MSELEAGWPGTRAADCADAPRTRGHRADCKSPGFSHAQAREQQPRGDTAVFASVLLLFWGQITHFCSDKLNLEKSYLGSPGCQKRIPMLNNLWPVTKKKATVSVPDSGRPVHPSTRGQRSSEPLLPSSQCLHTCGHHFIHSRGLSCPPFCTTHPPRTPLLPHHHFHLH